MKAIDLAEYVILHTTTNNTHVTNIKLQKILYFVNVAHLLAYKAPLITDAQFERFDFGPTIRSVYTQYAQFGGAPIDHILKHIYLDNLKIKTRQVDISLLTSDEIKFIDTVVDTLVHFEASELVDKSQTETQFIVNNINYIYDNKQSIAYWQNHQFWK